MEISAPLFPVISGLNAHRDQLGRPASGGARVDQIGRPVEGGARVDQIGRPAPGYQMSATGVVTGITQWPFEDAQKLSVFG